MLLFTCAALLLAASVESLTLSASLKNHWSTFKEKIAAGYSRKVTVTFWVLVSAEAQKRRDEGNYITFSGSELLMQAHKKDYHPEVDLQKRTVFAENVKTILKHNLQADLGEHSHRLGVNKYSDMPHEEFVEKMNGLLKGPRRFQARSNDFHHVTVRDADLPTEVNWVKQGLVTPVKDQGECGSCWTFSAVGALEGAWAKKTGNLIELSQQNLLDCASNDKYGNLGCDGGLPDQAFQYVLENKGIDKDTCYPYYGMQFNCYFNPTCIGANITSYKSIGEGDEQALKEALATVGPISIAMDASHESLQHYRSGIYRDPECDPEGLDHAVLLVGYGTTEDGHDYWLIKNSWGDSWGLNGYFMMARNENNMCGVASYSSYPVS